MNNDLEVMEEKTTNDLNLSRKCTLTTFDNPYDPFTNFDEWFAFDTQKGYYTCSKLARIAKTTDEMTDVEVSIEKERAIDEIIKHDFLNMYKKVYKNT